MKTVSSIVVILLLATATAQAAAAASQFPGELSADLAQRLARSSAPLRAEAGAPAVRDVRGLKAPAALAAIVISCDFADSLLLGRYGHVPGSFPPPLQTDLYYAAHDSVYLAHQLQDVAAYYADVSGGRLQIQVTVHPRTVNLPHPMSWYGNHPTEGEQPIRLAADVIDSLDQEIDFSRYDTVVLVHAGAGEETDILGNSPEQVYSTYLNPEDFARAVTDSVLEQPYLPAWGFPAGTGIDRVLILPETERQDPFGMFNGGFGSLGVYCFEFGLHLGMLSLSDFTPSGHPDSQGVGQYELMGYGLFVGLGYIPPQPGPFNKILMGWLTPFTADPDEAAVWSLTPAADVGAASACARVDVSGQEYWLAEYRLQDPNGDRRYTFPGDLNGNGLPDFWDANSEYGDGTPTGLFDPATDTHESLRGAEWDFAMSENSRRQAGELGAGSGVYIWHVDEAVLTAAFGAASNVFNADPDHKSVDLEEADGIQDLDSAEPSAWQLGGDDDSFRGEDHTRFGPDTRPDTRSNGGLPTGVVFAAFSNVCRDSNAYTVVVGDHSYRGFDYADTMTFSLGRGIDEPGARLPAARRTLPAGVDLTGSHLLAVDLDASGSQEIVAADHGGGVWAFTGDLTEFQDRDGDPATAEPVAVGRWQGEAASWLLPAAAGDLDGDGAPDLVLTTRDGLYAFHADGSPLVAAPAGSDGLLAEVPGCNQPPVLLPRGDAAERGDPGAGVRALVAWARDGACGVTFYGGAGLPEPGGATFGAGYVASPPQRFGHWLLSCVADTVAGTGRLVIVDLQTPGAPAVVPLRGVPGPWPLVAGFVPGTNMDAPAVFVMVVGATGAGETLVLSADGTPQGAGYAWPEAVVAAGPVAPGGALPVGARLARVGQTGDWLAGWPVRAQPALAAGGAVPLVARIQGAPDGFDHYLFTAADGRLLAYGGRGETVAGWPRQGPAAGVATPALGAFGGGGEADLVAAGACQRIVGNADGGSRLVTEASSSLMVWHDVAAASNAWPMWGGSAWRSGDWDAAGFVGVPPVAVGSGLVAGSHFCYPNPLTSDLLHVRAQLRAAGRARVTIHDLAGEQVAATEWRAVPAVEPFSLDVGLPGVASGMYLCRLVVETADGGSDVSVVAFAVAR